MSNWFLSFVALGTLLLSPLNKKTGLTLLLQIFSYFLTTIAPLCMSASTDLQNICTMPRFAMFLPRLMKCSNVCKLLLHDRPITKPACDLALEFQVHPLKYQQTFICDLSDSSPQIKMLASITEYQLCFL